MVRFLFMQIFIHILKWLGLNPDTEKEEPLPEGCGSSFHVVFTLSMLSRNAPHEHSHPFGLRASMARSIRHHSQA